MSQQCYYTNGSQRQGQVAPERHRSQRSRPKRMHRQIPVACVMGAFLLTVQCAVAAVVEVDVTIKSVDAKGRSIAVVYKTELGNKTIDLDVSRKAGISLNDKPDTLESLGGGLKAKVSYDKELLVVTRIVATGTPTIVKQPELVELSELSDDTNNDHAWLSADGLTIYWDRTSGKKGNIWTAHRDKPELPFGATKMLFSGKCPTVTQDDLQMILVGDRTDGEKGMALQVATRESPDKPFSRPKEINNLRDNNAWSPCLSPDDLTLYFGSRSLQDKTFFCTRKDKGAAWGKAKAFTASGFEGSNVSLSFITPDGLTIFGQDSSPTPRLMILSRSSTKAPFSDPKPIKVNQRPLYGYWPRYVSATQELFFVRLPLDKGRWDKSRPVGIWVVKHFVLPGASNGPEQSE